MNYYLPFPKSIQLGQPFGSRPNMPPNPAGGHNGDDWLTVIGVPVRAAGDGVVTFAGQFDSTYADNFGWNLHYGGNMVVLNMDGATAPYFEYGHLSKILVKTGQRVKAGQIIALTGNSDGNTGISTGPHCHVGCLPYNFNLNTNTYGRVNPRLYMTKYWDDSTLANSGTTVTPIPETKELFTVSQYDNIMKAIADVGTTANNTHAGVWNGGKDKNGKQFNYGVLPIVVHNQTLIAQLQAQLSGLVGALNAVAGGAAFDEGKLLAGVKAAAEEGTKAGLASGSIPVDVTVNGVVSK